VCHRAAAGLGGGPDPTALWGVVASGLGAAGQQTPAVGADARVVCCRGLDRHGPAVCSALLWLHDVPPPRGERCLVLSLPGRCDLVPSNQGISHAGGVVAPPGGDAAAFNTTPCHIKAKKSPQKTAMAGRHPHRAVRSHGRIGFTSHQRELLSALRAADHRRASLRGSAPGLETCGSLDGSGGTTRRSPAPNWVLRTAIGPASIAGQLAVRSTGAQH
jgi:hypothetical protein